MIKAAIRYGVRTQSLYELSVLKNNKKIKKAIHIATLEFKLTTFEIVGTDIIIDAPLNVIIALSNAGYELEEI